MTEISPPHPSSAAAAAATTADADAEHTTYPDQLKCRVFKTFALYAVIAGTGIGAPLVGMTIVHMEYVFNSSTHVLAFTFLCQAIGYTVGAVLCGLIFDRTNKELSCAVSMIAAALATLAAGFVGNVYAFMVILFLQGVFIGFICGGTVSYCVVLWTDHRLKDPLLQASQAIWSLAATVGPFVVRPFLVELPKETLRTPTMDRENSTANDSYASASVASLTFSWGDDVSPGKWREELGVAGVGLIPEEGIANVRFAYAAVAGLMFFTSSFFLVLFLYDCSPATVLLDMHDRTSSKELDDDVMTTSRSVKKRRQRNERVLKNSFLVMVFVFFLLYAYIEGIPNAYFTSFALKHLHWNVQMGTLVVSVFFGALFAGRIVAIPVSLFLRPRTMLCANLLLTAAAYLLLLFVEKADNVMWASAGLSGFSMGSTFGTMILWVSEVVTVTGRVSSVMLVGSSVGLMTGPLLVGQLFDAASPMWMVYVLVLSAGVHVLLMVLMFVFVRKWKKRRRSNDVGKEFEKAMTTE